MNKISKKNLSMATCFALLNVVMYLVMHKFWFGGSSFLTMIGVFGPKNGHKEEFLLAFIVNLGLIIGGAIGAIKDGEFHFHLPKANEIPKAILGGALMGIGVTLAPGTCTTAFVTGMPMLSVSSFISAAGIFIGAFIVFRIIGRR
ncbi:MAG: YeeE/YedE thiosulfate transporter family protein [bacterium]|nr:YeeE/YedE thiosulfate transporter family protein [bacterium]